MKFAEELSEEDQKLKDDLDMLVERLLVSATDADSLDDVDKCDRNQTRVSTSPH